MAGRKTPPWCSLSPWCPTDATHTRGPGRPGYGARWGEWRVKHRARTGVLGPLLTSRAWRPSVSSWQRVVPHWGGGGGVVPLGFRPSELFSLFELLPLERVSRLIWEARIGSLQLASIFFAFFFFFFAVSAGSARDWRAGGTVVVGALTRNVDRVASVIAA